MSPNHMSKWDCYLITWLLSSNWSLHTSLRNNLAHGIGHWSQILNIAEWRNLAVICLAVVILIHSHKFRKCHSDLVKLPNVMQAWQGSYVTSLSFVHIRVTLFITLNTIYSLKFYSRLTLCFVIEKSATQETTTLLSFAWANKRGFFIATETRWHEGTKCNGA